MTPAARALSELGFTGLEAEVYAFLLGQAPATGYRIAQGIGKPVANTYKAIASLHAKGAIEVDDGNTRLCRPVPSDELIGRLARDFEARKEEARVLLQELGAPEADDRIYQLRSRSQVLQRAAEMLLRTQEVAVGVLPADALEALADALGTSPGRVVIATAASVVPANIEAVPVDPAMPADLFILAIDGEESLCGTISSEEASAFWTRNPAMARPQFAGASAMVNLRAVASRLEDGAGPKRISKALVTAPGVEDTPGGRPRP
jgi:sugar-specific transcriptional regulator TrmB